MFIIVLCMQARYHVKRGNMSKAHEESNAGGLMIYCNHCNSHLNFPSSSNYTCINFCNNLTMQVCNAVPVHIQAVII